MAATALPTETVTATYTIYDANLPLLNARLAKINKAARKIGIAEVTYRIIESKTKTFLDEYLRERVRLLHVIEVTGERPRINGWTFIAALRHFGEDGTIIAALPGHDIPARYRDAGSDCDHCRHRRIRNNTYLLQNDAGDIKQVGSTCLVDFLGHEDPHAVAESCGWFTEIAGCCGDDDDCLGGGGYGSNNVSLVYFLSFISLAIRTYGWVSRTRARDMMDVTATANEFWHLERLSHPRESEDERLAENFKAKYGYAPIPTDADRELAQAAIAWALALEERGDLNDYLHNLLVVARTNVVDFKVTGLAASMIPAYQRATDQLAQREAAAKRAPSQHFGTVGKREVFTLTLVRLIITGGGMYGPSYLHIFEDTSGNRAKWFASSDSGMLEGETYEVKATVKQHGDYQGQQETVLTRCAIQKKIEAAAAA